MFNSIKFKGVRVLRNGGYIMFRFVHLLLCAILAIFAASALSVSSFAKEPQNRKKVLMKELKDSEAKALKYSRMGQPQLADKFYKKAVKAQNELDIVNHKDKVLRKKLARLHKKDSSSERKFASVVKKEKKDKKKKKNKRKHKRIKKHTAEFQ